MPCCATLHGEWAHDRLRIHCRPTMYIGICGRVGAVRVAGLVGSGDVAWRGVSRPRAVLAEVRRGG